MTNKDIIKYSDIICENVIKIYEELKKTNNAKKYMQIAGVSASTLSYWRHKTRIPELCTIKKITKSLGVDLYTFCTKQINVKLTYNLEINFN